MLSTPCKRRVISWEFAVRYISLQTQGFSKSLYYHQHVERKKE